MPITSRPIRSAVRVAAEHPWVTVVGAMALCVAALWFVVGHFDMTSDTAKLISDKVAWRRRELAMDAAFPQNGDSTVVVIDGATPELAEAAAASLTARLTPNTKLFRSVQRPDGGPYFAREGLLFLPTKEVQDTVNRLVSSQPFLGPMAYDPSLRGIMTAIATLADGVQAGQAPIASVETPLSALADSLEAAASGKPAFFSWQGLVGATGGPLSAPKRRFIVIRPKLDYGDLTPGVAASDAIRAAVRSLALDSGHGVRVRLTGSVPLSDEEFSSLADRAWLVSGAMVLAVLVMLWLAVRSFKLVAAILATTFAGLLLTTAAGLVTVGRFNLISVAFIPLFVGLGVDFGIQLSVRYRAERLTEPDPRVALQAAAAGIGGALTLAAAAITLGFLAFLPTQYIGVSELGIIAGVGMVLALALNLTLLPALIVLFQVRRQTEPVGNARLAPVDRFLVERRKLVLWAFALSMAASIALLPWVRFDFNPLHLRNIHGEAMSTITDLMGDPSRTPNTIDVLAPSLDAANRLAERLDGLPEVAQTVTLSSFVPDEQAPKLAAISDAQLLLDPTLNPFEVKSPPSDAEVISAMHETAAKLRAAAPADPGAARLAKALETLAAGPPAGRARAAAALVPPLNTLLDQLRTLLTAAPVTLDSLPAELKRDWIAADGRARIQVSPRGDSNDNHVLQRFSKAVQALAPEASGPPISIQEAGKTVSGAFIEAGLLSLATISLLLLIVLRSFREVAFTLAPIVLAGFLTLGTCVVIGQPINFANVIAFPLLFGVGVAFHIYFVMAWRSGMKDLLQSSLARGVFFSALTTGTAFGSLMLSSHPGTASMGKILMISLLWTLVAALIFEPALLGPPPRRDDPKAD